MSTTGGKPNSPQHDRESIVFPQTVKPWVHIGPKYLRRMLPSTLVQKFDRTAVLAEGRIRVTEDLGRYVHSGTGRRLLEAGEHFAGSGAIPRCGINPSEFSDVDGSASRNTDCLLDL